MKTILRAGIIVCVSAVTLLLLTGCTTPLKSREDRNTIDKPVTTGKEIGTVVFSSIPPGVDVYIEGKYKGTTPMTLRLEGGRKYKVEFKKEELDYETETMTIDSKAGTVIVNMQKKK